MREIVVISGKGGTGKTSLTAAFAHQASLSGGAVVCDLDVDAPDLHILLDPERLSEQEFVSGFEAAIDPGACTGCGLCLESCRFDAIRERDGVFSVDPMRCEGCKVCVALCPAETIAFPAKTCGTWGVSRTRFGTLVHAQLFPGEENSGRLVTLLKREAREIAKAEGIDLVLCDGAPGIGCPVISSLSGVEMAVVVTEPTPSGRHDLERVCEVCDHFKVKTMVVVNKADLNLEQTARIKKFCREKGYGLLGEIPHAQEFTRAMVERLAVTEYSQDGISGEIGRMWAAIEQNAGPGK